MKRLFYLPVFVLLVFLFLGGACAKNDPIPPRTAEPIALSTQEKAILDQGQDFSIKLFKNILMKQKEQANIFLSPYSVSMALGMLYNGAAGETKEEIATVLGLQEKEPQEINSYYQKLTQALLSVDPTTQLSVANALWLSKNDPIKADFAETNRLYYNAEVATLDFLQASSALKTINDWGKKQTQGCIPEILTQISPSTLAILTNAVFFKGIWNIPFNKEDTHIQSFFNADESISQVPLMIVNNNFAYTRQDGFAMLSVPYGNGAFHMEILLPDIGNDLDYILERMTASSLEQWREASREQKISLLLPRFSLEKEFDLIPVLRDMGMPSAFNSRADFSALSDQDAHVSDVIHKSYLKIDEEGTTAAAVTAIVIIKTSVDGGLIPFTVNRPFIFTLSEKSTGAILFIGKVEKLS